LIPVLIANIGALSSGLALGYSAILLPQIKPVIVGNLQTLTIK
jgi:hypothetical protein